MIENLSDKLIKLTGDSLSIISSSEVTFSAIISDTESETVIDLKGVEFVFSNTFLNIFGICTNDNIHVDSKLRLIISKNNYLKGFRLFTLGFIDGNNTYNELEFFTDNICIELLDKDFIYRRI